ncbi:MAG: hypothetical protein IKK08_06140 [Clostridia bacterium]|nr:hypothetical protein [Clostridia bacterium]
MKKQLIVRILPTGEIRVETEGMYDDECIPYAEKMCHILQAFPIAPPVLDTGSHPVTASQTEDDLPTARMLDLRNDL